MKESFLLLLINFLGAPLFYGLSFIHKFRREKSLRILVIQTAKIGDLVCSTPVFREIKRAYPESFLAVLVIPQTATLLKYNPHLDEIILLDCQKYQGIRGVLKLVQEIKQRQFNWSFSLVPGILNTIIPFWSVIPNRAATISPYASRGIKILSLFNSRHLAYQRDTLALRHYLNLLKFIKIKEFNEKKEVFVSFQETEKALQFLKGHNLRKEDFLVGISLTAGKRFKEWPLENFARLADKLVENLEAKIIFIGSLEDEQVIDKARSLMRNQIVKATNFNLIESAALLKELSLFISVDTGPLYIANALETPVIDMAGPCSMDSQRPDNQAIIIQKKISCQPCSFIMSAPSYCREGHLKCIKDITVEEVFTAVQGFKLNFPK